MNKQENKNTQPKAHLRLVDVNRDYEKLNSSDKGEKVLSTKTANEWIEEAKLKPIPKRLFDCLWYEGEVAILFADTNNGKSILAVQIADGLTKGLAILCFQKNKKCYKVLYCDFEMSTKQFENRYSNNYQDHYDFSPNLFRAELEMDEFLLKGGKSIEEQIGDEILSYITKEEVDVVIIDNLTYILKEIEKSKNVQPLMQKLKWISKKFNVSILVLAHTPKRDSSKPINNSDLGGSKFLSNFADSIFAIGKSSMGENLRYVKQIKSRNSAILYGSDNVIVCKIDNEFNFLNLIFEKYDEEQNHLVVRTKEELAELDRQIIELYEEHPDWSYQKIADAVGGINKMKVKRVLDRHKGS